MEGVRWSDAAYFGAELAVYVAVAWWGFTRDAPTVFRWLFAVSGVVVLAVSWGLFAAPRAAIPLTGVSDAAFRCLWFAVGAAAAAVVVVEMISR